MRIDLLTHNALPYTFENYAAEHLHHALQQLGVECRRITDIGAYLYSVHNTPPDWTLAFEDLLGRETPLCDVLALPHFHWERLSLERVPHLLKSRFGEVGFHTAARGVHTLPLPVEVRPRLDPLFEVIAFVDLTEESRSLVESFESRVDIFGAHRGKNWLVRLKNREHVHLHMPLPYTEQLRALQMSALAVLDREDPLYLPALGCGCLPVCVEEVPYFLHNRRAREEAVHALTKKWLPRHSWSVKSEELIQCLSR